MVDQDLKKEVVASLNKLPDRDRIIVGLRMGFSDGDPYTFKEIAQIFRVCPSRIKQIYDKNLRKLRHPRFSNLKEFY